jgi:hypothetical protein
MGGLGIIVGATGSAAANIRSMQNGEIQKGQAIGNVVRDAAGAGVATAAATAIVGRLGLTGLVSVAGLLTVATATRYLYNAAFESPKKKIAPEPTAKQPVKKAAAKKPAKKSAKTTAKKEA